MSFLLHVAILASAVTRAAVSPEGVVPGWWARMVDQNVDRDGGHLDRDGEPGRWTRMMDTGQWTRTGMVWYSLLAWSCWSCLTQRTASREMRRRAARLLVALPVHSS